MLKTCWDCLVGKQAENEVFYGSPRNGDALRKPLWPNATARNEIMFLLPRQLNMGDEIRIEGNMQNDPESIALSLTAGLNSSHEGISPDHSNVACQLVAYFPSSREYPNQVILNVIQDGYPERTVLEDYSTTDLFSNSFLDFNFSLKIRPGDDSSLLDVYLDDSLVTTVSLKHHLSDVRYLILSNDVAKVKNLNFVFA